MLVSEVPPFAVQLIILASCSVGILLVLVLLNLRMSRRLATLEKSMIQLSERGHEGEVGGGADVSPGGAFEAFLEEDPAREQMSKSEQFAAYRQWRHEKGMNWGGSGT